MVSALGSGQAVLGRTLVGAVCCVLRQDTLLS